MRTLAGLTLHWLEVLRWPRPGLQGRLSHCPCTSIVTFIHFPWPEQGRLGRFLALGMVSTLRMTTKPQHQQSISSADDIACHMADLLKLYLEMPEIESEAASAEMVSDMAEQMHEPMQEYFIPGTACSNDLQVAMSSQQMAVHTRTALLIRMITEAGQAITEENDT